MSGTGTESSAAGAQAPPGVTPPGSGGGRSGFLSDVIVDLGFASRETVEQAVRAARSPGTTVARVLVDMNAISEDQLARATAERYGIDYIDLYQFDIDPAAANLVKPADAQRYQAVPVAFLGQVLLVAMGDPADSVGVNDIAAMTARKVRPAVAAAPALRALLGTLPRREAQVAGEAQPPAPAAEAAQVDADLETPAVEPPTVEPAPEPGEASDLREEMNALKRQLAGAEAKLQGADAEVATEPSGVPELQRRLAEAEAELEDSRARVREAKEVSAELETLRNALADAEEGLNARARQGDEAPAPEVAAERHRARDHAAEMESRLRGIRADVDARGGELEALRGRLTEAETELVRLRAELDSRDFELHAMRTRAATAEAEAGSAGARAAQAEREADEWRQEAAEARRLAEELEAAGERADGARRALAEMRDESDREREQSAVSERDLRRTLEGEKARRAELEQRLSEVETSAFAAERAFEELRQAQGRMREALRSLAGPE